MRSTHQRKKGFSRFFAKASWRYKGTSVLSVSIRPKNELEPMGRLCQQKMIFKASKSQVSKKAVERNRVLRRLRAAVATVNQERPEDWNHVLKHFQVMWIGQKKTLECAWSAIYQDVHNTLDYLIQRSRCTCKQPE